MARGERKHFIFEAQTAILAAVPAPAISPRNMRHIIAIHLQNEAGALTRVTGPFFDPRLQHRVAVGSGHG